MMKILCVIEINLLKTILRQYCISNQIDYEFSEINPNSVMTLAERISPDIILMQEKFTDFRSIDLIWPLRESGYSNEIVLVSVDDLKAIPEKRLRDYRTMKKIVLVGKKRFPDCLMNLIVRNQIGNTILEEQKKPPKVVLIVDDSKIIHNQIIDSLQETNFIIKGAYDGAQGLDMYYNQMPDIVITDIEMPGMDGLELCKKIKQQNTGRYIPILMISSRSRPLDIDTAFNYGADDYIIKPLVSEVIRDKVDYYAHSIDKKKQNNIVVVDDDKLVREFIRHKFLSNGLNIITADNGQQGYEIILKNKPEVVITDIEMPVMNGYELCERINSNPDLSHIQLLMLSSRDQLCDRKRAEKLGVRRYFIKPFDVEQLIIVVEQLLKENYRFYKYDFDNTINSITSLIKALETRDHYTMGHSSRVANMATELAKYMGLPESSVKLVNLSANLHDVGKIGIRDYILLKEDTLTDEEFLKIKEHAVIGAEILKPIKLLKDVIPLILFHHERWDGKGYPTMIKGEDIPLGARIIAVVDTYDAMTTDRPYRKGVDPETAIMTVEKNCATQFCPRCGKAFVEMMKGSMGKKKAGFAAKPLDSQRAILQPK